jgi:cytochrome P450
MEEKKRDFKSVDAESKARVDLLTKFLQAKVDNPELVDDRAVLGLTLSMVNAGSGTVATTLAATFYFLLKNPAVMKELVAEIDAHFPPPDKTKREHELRSYVVPFHSAQKLPFLDAVLKEIFRLWPGLGMQLIERLTPPEGAVILGEHIPGDIIVSCNAWIMHRHKPTFGEDVETFRPQRWLEDVTEPARLAAMNKALLVWGSGPNTCIGKNIAFLELFKVIPSVLRVFEVSDISATCCSVDNLALDFLDMAANDLTLVVGAGEPRQRVEGIQSRRSRAVRILRALQAAISQGVNHRDMF